MRLFTEWLILLFIIIMVASCLFVGTAFSSESERSLAMSSGGSGDPTPKPPNPPPTNPPPDKPPAIT